MGKTIIATPGGVESNDKLFTGCQQERLFRALKSDPDAEIVQLAGLKTLKLRIGPLEMRSVPRRPRGSGGCTGLPNSNSAAHSPSSPREGMEEIQLITLGLLKAVRS